MVDITAAEVMEEVIIWVTAQITTRLAVTVLITTVLSMEQEFTAVVATEEEVTVERDT